MQAQDSIETTKLVDVPMTVLVPPVRAEHPKMLMNCFRGMRAFWQYAMTTGIMMAVTAVSLTKDEKQRTTSISRI